MKQECSVYDQIKKLYTDLVFNPEKDFGWEKGKENARHLGYHSKWLARIPDQVWESGAAVGNPFSLGELSAGETVVDLGCGAGVDLCVAALLVGKSGTVIGVDLTPAMVETARVNAECAGFSNVVVHEGNFAALPLGDASTDVVISNGAINLSPSKEEVFQEVFRILRPDGRFQFADMVKDENYQSTATCCTEGSWADCVSGTLTYDEVINLMKNAGFIQAERVSLTNYRTSPSTIGATFRAKKPIN